MKRNLTYFGWLLLVVLLPNLFLPDAGPGKILRSPEIKQKMILRLNESKPDIVLVGNSLLEEGVGVNRFSNLTGVPTAAVAHSGSSSAWWYLAIKNVILAADHRPQLIVIFFRDNRLTKPAYRVSGKYKGYIDDIAGADESTLDQLAYLNQMDWLSYVLTSYVPLFRYRNDMIAELEDVVKYRLVSHWLQLRGHTCERAIARVFHEDNMVPEILSRMQLLEEAEDKGERYDFSAELPESFLPEIIRLTQENNIELCFVRMKKLRDLVPGREPDGLPEYIEDLKVYLGERGIQLYDFTHDPRVQLEHFGAGDHLNRELGRRFFTDLLIETLQPEWHQLKER